MGYSRKSDGSDNDVDDEENDIPLILIIEIIIIRIIM